MRILWTLVFAAMMAYVAWWLIVAIRKRIDKNLSEKSAPVPVPGSRPVLGAESTFWMGSI
ncbi:MAG TPA: hypothetical protein EYP49_06235 [Anaerolineae bacterium]|nr:hypothetical protein [Anaerolineae bacterium]HIP97111.1 hypothetical protein [Anaerolineae bacterium]